MAERHRDSEPEGWRERTSRPSSDAARARSIERAGAFVSAALDLLEEDPSADFSLRQVIGRARLSRRAFYALFDGKDELMAAAYEESFRRFTAELEVKLAPLTDPVERLRCTLDSLFSSAGSEARVKHSAFMSREYLRLALNRPADMRAAIDPMLRFLERELLHAMQSGAVRQDDPAVLAEILFNVALAHIPTLILGADSAGASSITARDQWDFCRRALGIAD